MNPTLTPYNLNDKPHAYPHTYSHTATSNTAHIPTTSIANYITHAYATPFKLHRRGPCVGMCLGTLGTYVPSEPD